MASGEKTEKEKDQEHIEGLVQMAADTLLAKYCENERCGVLMYQAKNCPGCGQFGRVKGKQ